MHIVHIIQLFINNDQRGLLPPQDISDVEEKAEGEENIKEQHGGPAGGPPVAAAERVPPAGAPTSLGRPLPRRRR